jgi:hypothetical protein
MELKKLAEKVADYQLRLQAGKARRIRPEHVEKVLDKLRRKEAELVSRCAAEREQAARCELARKLRIAREHIARAEWLLREIA